MATPATERQYQGGVHEHSRRLMSAWMDELGRADAEGRPTGALMISGNCVELLRACHILPMFPEVTALQNAIRKKSLPLILKAEQAGYSSDNCAYVKADIGLYLDGGMGPGTPIPFPTITVCNYVGCNVYVKWFEHLADVSGSRLFMLDVPFCRTGEPSPEDRAYVVSQLRELIALGEEVSGRKFDIDELREILAHAARAEEGYARCKDLCKHHPAPFDAYFDAINMMGPINVLRGTAEAAGFFEAAVAEFEDLVRQGMGPLSGSGSGPSSRARRPIRSTGASGTCSPAGARWRCSPPTPPWAASGSGASATIRGGRSSRSPSRCCGRTSPTGPSWPATRRSSATSRNGRPMPSSSTRSSRAGCSPPGRATCATTSRGISACPP
jgi:hypothetical protein